MLTKLNTQTFLLILFAFMLSSAFVLAEGIEFFDGTWEEVLEEAEKQDKMIFVDCYTTWCGPCKKMSKQVFTLAEVGDFYNDHFINFKVNMEKGEGPELKGKWKVKAYPTMLYTSASGEIVHRFEGARKPEIFIEEGRKSMADINKAADMAAQYEAGERSPDFLLNYASMAKITGQPEAEAVFNEYLDTQDKSSYTTEENMKLIFEFAQELDSKAFGLMRDNQAAFVEEFGSERVNKKIAQAAQKGIVKAVDKKDKKLIEKVKDIFVETDKELGEEKAYQAEISYYNGIEDWKKFAKVATKYFDEYEIDNPSYLNNLAWTCYERIDDKNVLTKAEEWILQSIELDSQYHNNDTYASILYKLGKDEEAILAAEKAITIAKYDKKNYQKTEELLDKILTQ